MTCHSLPPLLHVSSWIHGDQGNPLFDLISSSGEELQLLQEDPTRHTTYLGKPTTGQCVSLCTCWNVSCMCEIGPCVPTFSHPMACGSISVTGGGGECVCVCVFASAEVCVVVRGCIRALMYALVCMRFWHHIGLIAPHRRAGSLYRKGEGWWPKE